MEILKQNTLRGPNYWSKQFSKLIQTRLNIEHAIPFDDIVENKLLSIIHTYLPKFELSDTEPENRMVGYTAGLALALQRAAGLELNFWMFKKTIYPNIYNLLLEYEFEETGILAIKQAIDIIRDASSFDSIKIEKLIIDLKNRLEQERPSKLISELIQLSKSYSVPYIMGEDGKSIQIGYGIKSKVFTENADVANVKTELEKGDISTIPILAVTGSNGKTTTTRLLAHMFKKANRSVGYTTSDGIYVNNKMLDEGDTTGPVSAQVILSNEQVEIAVLESARGGIVRAGLGFTTCDIAIITNVQEDHLGISDIETIDDLAQVKGVLVNAVKTGGSAVLNANNEYTRKIGACASAEVAWFCIDPAQELIQQAIKNGKAVAYVEHDKIIVHQKNEKIEIASLAEVPITFNGTLSFMVENVLAATLAASVYGFNARIISEALQSFYPSPEQTPGRMNIYDINEHKLLVDFAHNPDGFAGIRDFLVNVKSDFKIGIIVGTGDRKDEDTKELGRISAQMFDLTLIHQVKFLRGRTAEELVELLVEGIQMHDKNAKWMRIPDSDEPLAFALKQAKGNSYIIALSDVLTDVPSLLKTLQKK